MDRKINTENALKRALEKRQSGSLPSNFTFKMMEQIRLEAVKQEKRKQRISVIFLVVALLTILASSIYCLFFYLDFKLIDMIPDLKVPTLSVSLFGFYTYIALLVLGLLGVDYWIRKKKSIDNK